jgi:sec-independent protein translocase protein TatA
MAGLGGWELIIILIIVVLIFGVGRISKIGGELGQGVKAFREGVNDGKGGDAKNETEKSEESTE